MNLQTLQKEKTYKINTEKLKDYFIMENETLIKARKHQMEALDTTYNMIHANTGGILWHSTGSGKTIMQKLILQKTAGEMTRIVVLDRTDLIHQTEYEFDKTFDNVIMVKNVAHLETILENIEQYKDNIIVTSLQKFSFIEEGKYEIEDKVLFLVDECHRSHTGNEGSAHMLMKSHFSNSVVIGLTGTPTYKTFLLFGGIINVYCFIDGIKDNVVLPFNYVDGSNLTINDAVNYFMNECDTNFKCMYVVKGIETVEECTEKLNNDLKEYGFKAMSMTYKTKKQKNKLQEFKDDKDYKFIVVDTKCLVGYNVPNLKYIFIDKRMKSLNTIFQGISRTNRTFTDKNKGIVIDMAGNSKEIVKSLKAYSSLDGFKEYLIECSKPKKRGKIVKVTVNGEEFQGTVKEISEKYSQFKTSGIYNALKNGRQYKKTIFTEVK